MLADGSGLELLVLPGFPLSPSAPWEPVSCVMCFRKYVQVCVQNLSALDFQLSHSQLVDVEDSGAMQLLPLNTQAQQVRRRAAQSTPAFPLPPSQAH